MQQHISHIVCHDSVHSYARHSTVASGIVNNIPIRYPISYKFKWNLLRYAGNNINYILHVYKLYSSISIIDILDN